MQLRYRKAIVPKPCPHCGEVVEVDTSDPIRNLIRQRCYQPDKTTVHDVDMIIRSYANWDDRTGALRIVESKVTNEPFSEGEARSYRLLDAMLRSGNPPLGRYAGFYLITRTSHTIDEATTFWINRSPTTLDRFVEWIDEPERHPIPPFTDELWDELWEAKGYPSWRTP